MKQAARLAGYEASDVLYMAMELSNKRWRLGFSNGSKMRQKTVEACDMVAVLREISLAKQKLGVRSEARVVGCYEAGRDGHWLHRRLSSEGIEMLEIDSSSIEQARGRKHVKTDRVDVVKLLDLLMRYCLGFRKSLRVVRVPSKEAESGMRLHREDECLVRDRGRVKNRMRGLLANQGVKELVLTREFESWLEGVCDGEGERLSEELKSSLRRLYRQYQMFNEQLREVAAAFKAELETNTPVAKQRAQLELLRAIGPKISRTLSAEAFAWREFKNTKEVGGMSGLTPTPNQSGDSSREQGIGHHGNRRVRRMTIELAWLWLRWQPQSALSQWYGRRFGGGGKRMRRIGIVALARKLLIALWKYLEYGVVPEGAVLKPVKG